MPDTGESIEIDSEKYFCGNYFEDN